MAIIAGAVFLAYFPCINGGFILDDDHLLTENNIIRAKDGLYRFWLPWNLDLKDQPADYWPLSNTTFWIEWRFWKLNPTGYHVSNLILHILDASLLWAVLQRLRIPGAWFAALLFAVHPVNVESVAWISQRKDGLAVLFFLLSILWWLRADQAQRTGDLVENTSSVVANPSSSAFGIWYWLSFLAFVLAMLSKGSVAILPLVLLLLAWWQRNQITTLDILRVTPLFLLSGVLTAVNLWFQTHGTGQIVRDVTFIQRVLGAGAVIWFYLWKAICPLHLVFVYPAWQIDANRLEWWLPLIADIAVTIFLFLQRNSTQWKWVRSVLFAWIFFGVALIPVMGLTDVGFMRHTLVADHYQHIAIIAVVALAAAAICNYRNQGESANLPVANIFAGLLAATLLFLTWEQTGLYVNAFTLYSKTVEDNPNSWMVQHNLGLEYYRRGELNQAIEYYETTLRINPECEVAYRNLGNALTDLDRLPEAIDNYNKALQILPDEPSAHYNLGLALSLSGRPDEAEPHYRKALDVSPDYPEANHALGLLLATRGQIADAIPYFERSIKWDTNFVEADVNLASAYAAVGRFDDAIKYAQIALKLAQSKGDAKMVEGISNRVKFYQERRSNPTENKSPDSAIPPAKP